MRSLLNRLVVTNSDAEANQAENKDETHHAESVEWGNVSSEATAHPESESSGEDSQLSTGPAESANPPDGTSRSTPDTAATSDEVDSMGADELLDNVLNGIAEPTLVADSAGRISHINSNACEMFETQVSAAIGASPAAVHGGEDLVARVLSGGKEITERQEEVVIDGKKRILSRTITPFHDGSGNVVGAMETAKDITEKVREQEKTDQLEAYQESVLDDLQDKLVRLAEGDLTLDSSVPEPTADFEEMETVYDEFTQLNTHLTTAVENYKAVLSRLTLLADDLDETSQELSANSEEVTASIEQISHSTEEMADSSQELAEQTDEADMAVSNLTATIEEITASVQEIDAETSEASKIGTSQPI